MKKLLATLIIAGIVNPLMAQDFNTMTGDWMRVKVEYRNGAQVPNNHSSRALIRYHFTKKNMFMVVGDNTMTGAYERMGNALQIAPIQKFEIEEYSNHSLVLVDAGRNDAIRYYMIPTDSFQISGMWKYSYKVMETDTVYESAPGITPIYTKGYNDFMNTIMMGFREKVGFDYSYVVMKDGTIGDVTINASTNPKLNKRLTQLVKKSSGKWLPASYKGKPINVQINGKVSLNNM